MAKKSESVKAVDDGAEKEYRVCGLKSVFYGAKDDPDENGKRKVVAAFGDRIKLTAKRAAQLGADVVVLATDWDAKVKKTFQKQVVDAG